MFTSLDIENEKEEEKVIFEFLKREDVSNDNKIRIIKKYNFKVNDIRDFNEDLYFYFMNENKMKCSTSNILTLFKSGICIDSEMQKFILKNINLTAWTVRLGLRATDLVACICLTVRLL